MISIRKISKWYGQFNVLKQCSTEVSKGEVVVVCGPSGSGKSTLIKCVNGLEAFQEGEIIVDDISVGGRSTNLSKLRSRVGMVFQHFELFPHLKVLQNLTIAQCKVLGRGNQEATEKALRLLEVVGCGERELLKILVGATEIILDALLLVDVGAGAEPLHDGASRIADRNGPPHEPTPAVLGTVH